MAGAELVSALADSHENFALSEKPQIRLRWQVEGDPDIGFVEIETLEQERFVEFLCQGVAYAIAKIQFGRMARLLAVGPISHTCDGDMGPGDRKEFKWQLCEQLLQLVRQVRFTFPVDDDVAFQCVGGGHSQLVRFRHFRQQHFTIVFTQDNCNNRGRVDNHFGSPVSS